MNKNKKIIIVIIIIAIIALVTTLGYFVMLKIERNKVQSTIEEMFSNLKSNENNNQKQEVLKEIESNYNEENSTGYAIDYIELFGKLNYSIVKDEVNFKEATVILDITNKDMKAILGNYILKSMQLAIANAFTPTYSEEQINEELERYLKEKIESDDIENITTQITLKMEKQNGKWIIKEENKEKLINAILPGFIDAVNQINDSFNKNEK